MVPFALGTGPFCAGFWTPATRRSYTARAEGRKSRSDPTGSRQGSNCDVIAGPQLWRHGTTFAKEGILTSRASVINELGVAKISHFATSTLVASRKASDRIARLQTCFNGYCEVWSFRPPRKYYLLLRLRHMRRHLCPQSRH